MEKNINKDLTEGGGEGYRDLTEFSIFNNLIIK